mmetsp:Transcript_41285/g.78920  ORF Transcript_41285/g.78920 Transcript_41285/m.78920 type:complete len:923 (-) Transcript_41285:213-2981(-)|eukprot:CAMPEP_0114248936 /NCGR_PEP_ID=MMETSP0058-20121206/13850_1 /TAXON_ID=36894 /ORGANISM="Pyramimonas parkeae, CCMP726" /LENGTH=922 /DNA_ID=CAMNT_0001362399 /DNA_START=229 /DNA_END=2997 /DNA_ORIENTATION=-
MADDEVLLTDVANSEAFRALDELVKGDKLKKDRADFFKSKYQAMHDALISLMDNDMRLMARAKTLNAQLQAEQNKLESNAGRTTEERSAVDLLRDDAEQAESEAALCRDREQILQLEITDFQRQKYEVRSQLDEVEREQAALMAPTLRQYQSEIATLAEEIKLDAEKKDAQHEELTAAKARIDELDDEMDKLDASLEEEKHLLATVSQLPEKIKKSSDVVSAALRGLKLQDEKLLDRLREEEIKQVAEQNKVKTLSEDHAKLATAVERARLTVEQKERAVDDIRKDLERESLEMEQHLADQAKTDIEMKGKMADVRRANEHLMRVTKDNEVADRKYKKSLLLMKQAQGSLAPLETTRSVVKHEVDVFNTDTKKQTAVLGELKREVDMYMNSYMKEETKGKDKGGLFAASCAEVAEMESEVMVLRKEERVRDHAVVELASQRERASRQAAFKVNKLRETREQLRVKDLIIIDLKKKRREVAQRLRDFQQLYDLVKNQRNKFVNLIQASSQSISEMKEKIKILGNEVDILRGEILNKDKLLAKAQVDHNAATVDRNHLQGELNKCAVVFRDKQTMLDEQISEIDKLNAIINGYEKEMLRLKKQYETQVEMRNHTGITLIDRNDELCILYEKANIQELVYKQGEVTRTARVDEIRLLKLEVQEVQRSVNVTRKLLPQIPLLDSSIASLQDQLLKARQEAEKLSEELESPDNKTRWRRLEGKIPDKEELTAKIKQLEERLNDKKEQLLEKELVLEEISSLADRLRQQAAEGRSDTLELAKKVNDYQQRIRGTTRKMMATVSELSMYQASALKLQNEKHDLTETVEQAADRLSRGEPPTEDAEREWYRGERERAALAELREQREQELAEDDPSQAVTRTTAEPRPNAYLPEALGIPRPYGAYAPFKPSDPGSTMRHIRKPEPREIVI